MNLSKKLLDIKLGRVKRRSCQRLYRNYILRKFNESVKNYLDIFAQGNLEYEVALREYINK